LIQLHYSNFYLSIFLYLSLYFYSWFVCSHICFSYFNIIISYVLFNNKQWYLNTFNRLFGTMSKTHPMHDWAKATKKIIYLSSITSPIYHIYHITLCMYFYLEIVYIHTRVCTKHILLSKLYFPRLKGRQSKFVV
jgi:hypothetical protein